MAVILGDNNVDDTLELDTDISKIDVGGSLTYDTVINELQKKINHFSNQCNWAIQVKRDMKDADDKITKYKKATGKGKKASSLPISGTLANTYDNFLKSNSDKSATAHILFTTRPFASKSSKIADQNLRRIACSMQNCAKDISEMITTFEELKNNYEDLKKLKDDINYKNDKKEKLEKGISAAKSCTFETQLKDIETKIKKEQTDLENKLKSQKEKLEKQIQTIDTQLESITEETTRKKIEEAQKNLKTTLKNQNEKIIKKMKDEVAALESSVGKINKKIENKNSEKDRNREKILKSKKQLPVYSKELFEGAVGQAISTATGNNSHSTSN